MGQIIFMTVKQVYIKVLEINSKNIHFKEFTEEIHGWKEIHLLQAKEA